MWNSIAFAQEAGEAAPDANPFGPMLLIIAFVAIFYFFLMRPNMKREKERREMLAALNKGDEVVTTGGIYGTIVGLDNESVVLRVSDDPAVKLQFARAAIARRKPERDSDQD